MVVEKLDTLNKEILSSSESFSDIDRQNGFSSKDFGEIDKQLLQEADNLLIHKYHRHSLLFSVAILITILGSNVMPFIWVGVRFEDKSLDSEHDMVQAAHYKVANIFGGDKDKMRGALVGNVAYLVMCYCKAILNCVILRLK